MRLLLILIGVAAMIGMAAPAYADSFDEQFLAALKQAGLTYQNADATVATGKSVCKLVASGEQAAEVVADVQNVNPGLHGDSAAKFTAIAASAYCPDALADGAGGNGSGG